MLKQGERGKQIRANKEQDREGDTGTVPVKYRDCRNEGLSGRRSNNGDLNCPVNRGRL
jgi:hypothetical protein